MVDIEIQNTEDGSRTLFSERFQETYHSVHGAVTESMHVFIKAGLLSLPEMKKVTIFEVGFGTGLNALLTYRDSVTKSLDVEYYAIEKFRISDSMAAVLNYWDDSTEKDIFLKMHNSRWGSRVHISSNFRLMKIPEDLVNYDLIKNIDLIYFDAFSPNVQPELWTDEIFKKLFECMNTGGILTTYCAKGAVRRSMKKAGFVTERLPGPPGKREMLRATKL